MPKLLVSLPDGAEVSFDLSDPVITLGRLDDNLLQIDDPSVSSRHAHFSLLESGNYALKDLGSTNGTRVNGERVSEATLRPGDQVRFGKVESVYESEVASADDAPRAAGSGKGPAVGAAPSFTAGALPPTAAVAERSHRPADFANAAPFKKQEKTRDPLGRAMMALAAVAFLLFLVALFYVYRLQAPGGLPT